MKAKVILAALVLVLLGVGSVWALNAEGRKGIYYEPLETDMLKQPQDSTSQKACSLLFYNGKIYTCSTLTMICSTNSLKEFNQMFHKMQLEEISDVYTYDAIHWSTDKTLLYEPKEEHGRYAKDEGKLYKTKDYPQNRLCICNKSEYPLISDKNDQIVYTIEIFTCLNGITLNQGKELFQDILHLEDIENVTAWKWVNYATDERGPKVLVKPDEEIFSSFLSALNEGKLLSTENASEIIEKIEEEEGYIIWEFSNCFVFEDSYGVKEIVHILPNGYGVFFSPEGTPFMVQFDAKLYEQLVKKYF
jgi:hypothetical protein